MSVNGREPWMSQVISSKTVSNMLTVTKRTPRSISRRASRQLWQQHVGGHLAALALEVAQHAAGVRVLDAAGEQPAGLHHLVAGVVDGRRRVVDAADQGVLVGVPGHLREDLRNLDPGHVGADRLE